MSQTEQARLKPFLKTLWGFLAPPESFREPPPADLIFTFGYGLTWNAEQAIKLWLAGKAPYILFTGRNMETGFGEAERDEQLALAAGIKPRAILVEPNSTNTLENVVSGMALADSSGVRPNRVIAVAVPIHLRRIVATFGLHYPRVEVFPTSSLPNFDQVWPFIAMNPEVRWRIAKEVFKLCRYAEQGDIAHVEIPDAVWQAALAISPQPSP